ncbi:MAG: hypothetical protein R2838_16605 [Caldilineaceae bacterium]
MRSLGDGFGVDLNRRLHRRGARRCNRPWRWSGPTDASPRSGGDRSLQLSLDPLVQKAVTLQGSFSHTFGTWERVIRLMGSGQNTDPVIGGVYAIDEWETAFAKMEEGENVKSVLKF